MHGQQNIKTPFLFSPRTFRDWRAQCQILRHRFYQREVVFTN